MLRSYYSYSGLYQSVGILVSNVSVTCVSVIFAWKNAKEKKNRQIA